MDRKPRVLLVAEMCNPDWVSVPRRRLVAARALRAVADPYLVTAARNGDNIERAGLTHGRTSPRSTPGSTGRWGGC